MNAFSTNITTQCYHCGDDCGKHPVIVNEKFFCCEGCKTVYEILQESNLCDYYQIEKTPGIKKTKTSVSNKYASFDIDAIRDEYIHFSHNHITGVTFFIPNIHCSSCIWLLENLNKLHESVLKVLVDFPKKEVTITFKEDKFSLRALAELLEKIGYPPQIETPSKKKKQKKALPRSFYIKLGVAGFCFGNIMLLSIPEYLGMEHESDLIFTRFFGWLNLLLSLPVFFYSSTEYLSSAWHGIKQKFINMDVPISLGIITLFSRSAYEIISGTGTGYMDSLAGLVFFLLIGKWYQQKTYAALSFDRDYASYFPVSVTLVEKKEHKNVLLKELKPGDRVLIRNQELIPADAVLIKGQGQIDYSFVTGESESITKESGDSLYAGGRQCGQSIEIEIKKQVKNSYLTQLWNQDIFKKEKESGLTALADLVSKYFTLIIILLSLATSVFWYINDPKMVASVVTAVLIVACPCALALTIPFAYGNATRLLSKKGIYLKNTNTIETLSKIDTILFDKTGTLTIQDASQIRYYGKSLSTVQKQVLQSMTAHSTHPLSITLQKYLKQKIESKALEDFQEITGKGLKAVHKNYIYKLGSASFTNATVKKSTQQTKVYFSENNQVIGYFEFGNLYRKGFERVMDDLGKTYELHLLSGDNASEQQNLAKYFGNMAHMHFNQSPQDKLNYVKRLQQKGKKVLMIGDGLNDAGALRQSNAGISISDDIYHFSPSCDAIMDANVFSRLSRVIAFTKSAYFVVLLGFIFSFSYNLAGLSFAVSGYLTPLISAILMPLSSATVVIFATAATYFRSRRIFGKD
ncbi:MAG: heavy metal translocating P-type ATPase metal-binding domain-containing protein [Bacteroidota bacterium]